MTAKDGYLTVQCTIIIDQHYNNVYVLLHKLENVVCYVSMISESVIKVYAVPPKYSSFAQEIHLVTKCCRRTTVE